MPDASKKRVVVIGAGPVGLCLALRLAQQDIPVTVVEALGEDNVLEQVPRAGTNHPATLELFNAIGLYERLAPRGIVAPLFHYWDRHDNRLIAEFDHAHLKDDTLRNTKHQDHRGSAGLAKRTRIDVRWRRVRRSASAGGVAHVLTRPARASDRRRLPGERGGRAQHRAQGSRHRVRGVHLFGPHAQHRGGVRFPPARLHRAQLHLRSRRVVEPVSLEGPARPLARALPDRAGRRRGGDLPA